MPSTALAFPHDQPAVVLRDAKGTPVPLTAVSATGRLEGLIFELTVEQRYENRSARNLEAAFTFPLPLRAVLLGFDLEIGDRKLSAVAVARREASERYEKAIDEGDTAALIEHDGHGLYTVSLGNLLPGETAAIRYRYAELLDAHDGYVRLHVPTVISPRYGDPRDAGLEGPAVPNVDLLGEYPFEIRLTLAGLRDVSAVRSPSHRIAVEAGSGGLSVALERCAFLDRDFVLELAQAAIPTRALIARDGEGYVTLASATLDLDRAEQRPLALKILLDCSGSMGGDSIAAARRALLAILERLTPSDRVSLTRFGSTYQHVTEGLEPATATRSRRSRPSSVNWTPTSAAPRWSARSRPRSRSRRHRTAPATCCSLPTARSTT
jgi:Ca-activated chloride channel homolog